MSVSEVQVRPPLLETEEARILLENAREVGSLTADEIALALVDLDVEATEMDDFYQVLDELQIEVVAAKAEEPDAGAADWDAGTEVSTDALQLFLKDVGKVDLLTAAQEVELAKRIERGDHRAK